MKETFWWLWLSGVQTFHRWRAWPRRWLWTTVGMGITAAFVWGIYVFFHRIFRFLYEMPDFTRPFVLGFVQRLMAALMVALGTVVSISSITNTLSMLYLGDDIELAMALPVRRFPFLSVRLLQITVQSTYMVYLVMGPVLVALAQAFALPWTFTLWSLGVFTLFVLPVVWSGAWLTTGLVRWFPVRRLHQFTTALLAFTVVGLLFYVRAMRPERWVQAFEPMEWLSLLQELDAPGAQWMPYGWAATVMLVPYVRPDWSAMALPAAVGLGIWGVGLSALAGFGLWRSFYEGWLRARETLSRLRPSRRPKCPTAARPGLWIMWKEWWAFSRDPTQWGQVFLVIALFGIYFFNVRMITLPHPMVAYLVWVLNTAIVGLILSTLAVRFILPVYSLDGPAGWLLHVLPLDPAMVYRIRWRVYTGILVVLGMGFMVGTTRMLGMHDAAHIGLNVYIAVAMGLVMGTTALTASVRHRRLEGGSTALQLSIGAMGLFYMLASFAWILWTLGFAIPWLAYLASGWVNGWQVSLITGIHGISTVAVVGTAYRRGIAWSRQPFWEVVPSG